MCDCVILIKGRLSSSLRPTSLGSYILIFNFPSTSLFFTQFSFSLMATSPNPNYPFSLDCLFLPVSQGKMHGTLEQGEVDSSFLSYFQSQPEKEGSIENGISKFRSSEVNNCEFSENQTVPEASETVSPSMEKKRKNRDENCSYSEQSKDKSRKQRKYCKKEEQEKNNSNKKNEKKVSEEPPTGYIHVRARRGEATDSHSLAERARREKISERMKVLQELVPGCKQVTGKALILDEIINYVRSLQNQVEFLSMRLASTSPVVYNFCDNVSGYTTQMEKNESIKSPGQNSLIAFEETQSVFSSAYTCPSSLGNINSVLLDEKKLHNFSRGNESSISGLEDQNQRDINEALFGTMFCFQ